MKTKKITLKEFKEIVKSIIKESDNKTSPTVIENSLKNYGLDNSATKDISIELYFNEKSPDEIELQSQGDSDSIEGEFIITFKSEENNILIDGTFIFDSEMIISPESNIGYAGATENNVSSISYNHFILEDNGITTEYNKEELNNLNFPIIEKRLERDILNKIEKSYNI